MSIIVEPTVPYSSSQLDLQDPTRWARLFPLMRPSTEVVEAPNGQMVVIDTALSNSSDVLLAAIGTAGHISSKIVRESHLAAFSSSKFGTRVVTSEALVEILKNNGFCTENGVVIVKSASKQNLSTTTPGILELDVVGELNIDHILSLLLVAKPDVKRSFEKTKSLLEHFVKSKARTSSTFHEKKIGEGPSVIHAVGVAEFNSAKSAIDRDLNHLLSSRAPPGTDVVYSIHYSDINGLSRLENNILAHEISKFFSRKNLDSYITQSTIVDGHSQARGWSISVCAIPSTFMNVQIKSSNLLVSPSSDFKPSRDRQGKSKIQFSDSQARKIITGGCERVIKEEPTITEYDTTVGDGDCGYTLRDGAKQVLSFISNADLSKLPSTLSDLVDDLEVNMGGTSGALYCIFLSSLAQNIWEAPTFAAALKRSLEDLLKYTRARLGDRTCLDCLIPFVDTLDKTGDTRKALVEAEKGVESTKKLEAKLGRSSYLDESATRGVPDPGAYGLLVLLEGMVNV